MSWMLSIWAAAALLALCGGQSTVHEGNSLSGYHLCIRNETRIVSFLAMHKVPYTVTKPCGGWLLWKICTVTLYRMTHQTEYKTEMEQVTRCCDGYVQVGRYCALPVNRSGEFTAKPGSCPTADGLHPGSEDCEWDMDCPGWQKCCQRLGRSLCSEPASSANYPVNGGYRLNATVTVKADYQQLMSKDRGHLNHTRLLQAMVTGALQSEVSVYYLSSWPVHPYRTATSLLIECNFTLSLHNVTSKLHLLLKHIQEVSSVTVEDVNECMQPALRQCSLQAECNNTVGSYHCACYQGYIDVDPSNPGAHCTADARVSNTTEPPLSYLPPMNTTYSPASNTTRDPPGNSTMGVFNSTETIMTAALTNTSSVPYNSSHAPQWTSSAPYTSMSSTVESLLPATACSPPSITSLWSANVTGTSFRVYWSSQFQTNQTYQVVLSKGLEVISMEETNQTTTEISKLQPGVLYNVTVTPHACRSQGVALCISVKTDAQTLDATTRLTNIQFTADLQNTSSQAYRNLTDSIIEEICRSLSSEMKAMVRIEIRSFSPGSVVVNFTITFIPSQNQDISNVSTALLHSLMNSTKYTVDENNTSINDLNECDSGENDCSQWATCTNTWASYSCVCHDGFIDNNPERPGRACQAIATLETTIPPLTPTIFSTVSSTPFSLTTPPTSDTALITVTTAPGPYNHHYCSYNHHNCPYYHNNNHYCPYNHLYWPYNHHNCPYCHNNNHYCPYNHHYFPYNHHYCPYNHHYCPYNHLYRPYNHHYFPYNHHYFPYNHHYCPYNHLYRPYNHHYFPYNHHYFPYNHHYCPYNHLYRPYNHHYFPYNHLYCLYNHLYLNDLTSMTSSPTALRTATNASFLRAISVQCRVAAITVTVPRDFLLSTKIRESALYLGLPGCGVNGSNATHVQLTVAWNECVTRLVHNETYYTASVTLFNNMDSYISPSGTVEVPTVRLEVPIMCTYMKSMLISTDFGSMGYDMIKDVIVGSGSFQVTVQLMNGTMPLPHNYSLSPEEAVVLEVSLNTSSEQIKVVINRCWATPTPNPVDNYSPSFLENSCPLSMYTKVLMNGNSSTSRVSVQIFSVVNLNVLYLHCQVHICVQVGSGTCVPDCRQRTARSSNTIATAFGSSGPLLRSDEESLEEEYDTLHLVGLSCLGIGLTLFFIVGFACLFYYQRNRIGHYNFSAKPKQENFTYLVFNT
ncbi:uromodulin-like 1 [Enoplosus armatus]|uniref:uromodulin-like 1 n=1 Tax=Enoplosus armatus TaxID=215367 RepID=UPI003991E829